MKPLFHSFAASALLHRAVALATASAVALGFALASAPGAADVARSAQISFQDPATLAMVSIIDLHHSIIFWLVNTSVVVAGLFTVEMVYFYLREEENSLLKTEQRLSFTDDHALEFI